MGEWKAYTIAEIAAPGRHSLATGPFGSAIAARNFTDSGVPVIRGANLSLDVGIRLNDDGLVFVSPEKADEFKRSEATRGDLVFTCWGTIGQVGIIDNRARHERYIVSNKQMKLTLNKEIADPLFVYYLMSSPEMISRVTGNSIGSSVPGFNLTQLRSIALSLPPLAEQRAITEVLSVLDDKIALNEQIYETALSLGRSLLEKENQGNGVTVKIGDVADLVYGKSLPLPARREGSAPVFGCTGQVGWHDTALTENAYPVVGRKGANAGHVSWMPRPGWVIDTAFYARPTRAGLTSEALYFILEAAGIGSLIADSAVPGVNRNEVLNHGMLFPSPGRLEQFARQAKSVLAVGEQTADENRTLADLRDTLLPQLLSGKLRVKDAVRAVEEAV